MDFMRTHVANEGQSCLGWHLPKRYRIFAYGKRLKPMGSCSLHSVNVSCGKSVSGDTGDMGKSS